MIRIASEEIYTECEIKIEVYESDLRSIWHDGMDSYHPHGP